MCAWGERNIEKAEGAADAIGVRLESLKRKTFSFHGFCAFCPLSSAA
jgi:hypothetical protein